MSHFRINCFIHGLNNKGNRWIVRCHWREAQCARQLGDVASSPQTGSVWGWITYSKLLYFLWKPTRWALPQLWKTELRSLGVLDWGGRLKSTVDMGLFFIIRYQMRIHSDLLSLSTEWIPPVGGTYPAPGTTKSPGLPLAQPLGLLCTKDSGSLGKPSDPFTCALLSRSVVSDSATRWTVARQAPLSMGILQVRTLEWVAMPSCRGSSRPRDWTQISHIAGGFFTIWVTREVQEYWRGSLSLL